MSKEPGPRHRPRTSCLACRHSSMLQLSCRPWNLSVVCVVVLGLSNMLLTFLLLQSEGCGRTQQLPPPPAEPSPCLPPEQQQQQQQQQQQEEPVLQLDVRLGRWDARRLYRMFDAASVGTRFAELSGESRVCLATQTSLERMHSLVQLAQQWTGPVSVALFAAGDEEWEALQRYLQYLRRCYGAVRERVLFSVAVAGARPPRSQPRYFPPGGEDDDGESCRKPEAALLRLTRRISGEQTSWRVRNAYPQNQLRNLARQNCQGEFAFVTDVDIVPSGGLAEALERFLARPEQLGCDSCAYVVPTYEVDARARFPQNKSELLRLAAKGLARPFHQKVFIHNQFATNFSRWAQESGPEEARVSHEVTNFEFLYEPFYVARALAPPHDERFLGYGYTRNTQVYEMYVAGYKFKVLSPTFTVHWGLQTRKSRPAWRERQNSVNRKHFEAFKKEVFARYMRDPLKMLKQQG